MFPEKNPMLAPMTNALTLHSISIACARGRQEYITSSEDIRTPHSYNAAILERIFK